MDTPAVTIRSFLPAVNKCCLMPNTIPAIGKACVEGETEIGLERNLSPNGTISLIEWNRNASNIVGALLVQHNGPAKTCVGLK